MSDRNSGRSEIRNKTLPSLAAIIVATALASCGGGGSDAGGTEAAQTQDLKTNSTSSTVSLGRTYVESVTIERNGTIGPRLPVRFESFQASDLAQLREREQLEAVIAGAADEFSQMLLIKEWVAAQWPAGNPVPYPPWNALDILDWIRAGITGGHCGQYSQVLLQSLAALGMTARYVEIGSTSNPFAHFVVEAWSNQFNKWILLDADYNLHFERGGIPLSALEIHTAFVSSQLADVSVIEGAFRAGHLSAAHWPKGTAELYYYLRFHLKADHLSVPDEPPFDRRNDMVEWNDALTVPWEDSTVPSEYWKSRLTEQSTSNAVELSAALNQVRVTVVSQTEKEIVVSFENNLLDFARYDVRTFGGPLPPGEWQEHTDSTFTWLPISRTRVLEVRGVNSRGVPGPASVVAAHLRLQREPIDRP